MFAISLLTFGTLIGFGGGYGVREIISRRRRAHERARQASSRHELQRAQSEAVLTTLRAAK